MDSLEAATASLYPIAPPLALIARIALATVFIASALGKLRRRKEFRRSVAEYGILRGWPARAYADSLPWIEIVLGMGMLAEPTTPAAAAAASALLLSFGVAVAINMARGRRVPCACFGDNGDEPTGWWTIRRQVGLCGLAVVSFFNTAPSLSAIGGIPADTTTEAVLSAHAGYAVTSALVFAAAGLLLLLRREQRAFQRSQLVGMRAGSSSRQSSSGLAGWRPHNASLERTIRSEAQA